MKVKKYCFFCGTTKLIFRETGKLGCQYCLNVFQNEILIYQNILHQKKKNMPSPFYIKKWEKLLNESKNLDESEIIEIFNLNNIIVRYRIGRNFNGIVFPKNNRINKDITESVNLFFKDIDTSEISIRIGDEEHFRLDYNCKHKVPISEFDEKFQLNSIEKFAYNPIYGFISGCPSNFGKINKLSIRLNISRLLNQKILPSYLLPGWIEMKQTKEDRLKQSILFYIKNLNQFDSQKFLQYMYIIFSLNYIK